LLNILHISDVHFGISDPTAEQSRIVETLVEAVHAHQRPPDLCIFSGDLANFGRPGEFETGERWLSELVRKQWGSELLVVPGNHDIDRSGTRPHLFRAVAQEEKVYFDWSKAQTINCDHLRPFFEWHKAASGRLPLGGEWTNPFALHFCKRADPFPIHVICMNSSMFCCDDHDERNLILDTKKLNDALAVASREEGLVIVVAHHPLDFLTPWNRGSIETILAQELGAHLFLHGHKHETSAVSRTDNRGFGLTTLAAGAAYQGSKWSQDFSFYEFDFDTREITPRVYKYEPSGVWLLDNSRSRPFVVDIPQRQTNKKPILPPSPADAAPEVPPYLDVQPAPLETQSSSVAPPSSEPEPVHGEPVEDARMTRDVEPNVAQLEQEVDARRHAASDIQRKVLIYFSEREIDAQHYYAVTSRIKRAERIIEKYNHRSSLKSDYKLEMMTDVCGFRIVTRYQDEIPDVVAVLLQDMEDPKTTKSPFLPNRQILVEINNSRMEADSLSLVEPVRAICNQSRLKPQATPRVRDTGYSSIHFIAAVATIPGYHVREMRIEIQIRSAFEDAWGEIDHHIDYRERRGRKEIPRNKHLNVLKSMVDGLISYVDLIKKQSKEFREEQLPAIPTSRSINTPEDQMARLRGLPPEIFQRVRQAFDIWTDAYESRKGDKVNPDLFKKGANAFEALVKDFAGQPKSDRKLAAELDYVGRIEYAYMLQYTGETTDTEQAEKVYINILHLQDRSDDVTANYRLGALYRKLGFFEATKTPAEKKMYLDRSKEHLYRALQAVAEGRDDRIDKSHFLYDSLRREIGLTEWRISQDEECPLEVRLQALSAAIKVSYDVIRNPTDPNEPIRADTSLANVTKLSAINDFLYYRWYFGELSGGKPGLEIPPEEEQKYKEMLFEFYNSCGKERYKYNFIDTLLRLYIGDKDKARKLAIDLVSVLLRIVPKPPDPAKLGSVRWYGSLVRQLNSDQGDALTYAHEFLSENGYPPSIDP
jgi:ppGpp synthetase/RelA/SpoT-type nucleotidyltranferase/predicted MPP superfamily phosphohydrolase